MKIVARVTVVFVATFVAACDSGGDFGPAPPTLTRQDVENLPPGDATGPTFTGVYRSIRERVVGCRCRVGNCSLIHAVVGEDVTVNQFGGTVMIIGDGNLTLNGGVNQNGTFWCGGFDEVGDYSGGYVRVTGTFMPAGAQPTTIEISSDRTAKSLRGSPSDYDCDTTITGLLGLL
jgi:hypothetical protein